jgi:succinyl-CoA synthetase alpha subunit
MTASGTTTVQYKVGQGKKNLRVVGPDDADVVIEIDTANLGLDPSIAFMQGKLKAVGNTGVVFELLKSGELARGLAAIAAEP